MIHVHSEHISKKVKGLHIFIKSNVMVIINASFKKIWPLESLLFSKVQIMVV